MNSNVHALTWYLGVPVAGGAFTMADERPANRIASWSLTWQPFGSGVNSNVNALLAWNGGLIVGGQFTTAGGMVAHKIAEHRDPGWRTIGGNAIPPGGNVLALAANETNLYVGGSFVIPGVNATNIARWDGNAWHALGGGVLGRATPINALAVRGHELFAAGTITNAGGVETRAIARWDGTNWHAMGSGFERDPGEPTLSALAVFEDSIYVGGSFTRAGGRPSVGIARWIPEIPLRIRGGSFAPGLVSLSAETVPGLKLRLDGSSDLSSWVPVESVKSYSEIETLTDANPATGRRFYRVVAEP
jgi:hypothetical protein